MGGEHGNLVIARFVFQAEIDLVARGVAQPHLVELLAERVRQGLDIVAVPDTATPAPALGAGCAPAVADEFVRQQSLVPWRVFCPILLPAGFRLALADDPPDPNALGGSAAPTIDDLNPGGGTFITRLVGPNNAALVFVQGAGASIFVPWTLMVRTASTGVKTTTAMSPATSATAEATRTIAL